MRLNQLGERIQMAWQREYLEQPAYRHRHHTLGLLPRRLGLDGPVEDLQKCVVALDALVLEQLQKQVCCTLSACKKHIATSI